MHWNSALQLRLSRDFSASSEEKNASMFFLAAKHRTCSSLSIRPAARPTLQLRVTPRTRTRPDAPGSPFISPAFLALTATTLLRFPRPPLPHHSRLLHHGRFPYPSSTCDKPAAHTSTSPDPETHATHGSAWPNLHQYQAR